MNKHLALYTFGLFKERADHPANDGFYVLNDPIMALVDKAPGLIARSGYDGDPGPPSWGEEVYPAFYEERGDGWSPATLSLWEDLESAMAFSYFGLHARALRHGREWFQKPQWPPYALWWCEDGHRPTWREAVDRHALLHAQGPTVDAFTFKAPFDVRGLETAVDHDRVKQIAGYRSRRAG